MDCIVHGVAELDTTERLSFSCWTPKCLRKKKKIAKANSVYWYNINNNFLGIKDRTYSPLFLWGGGAEIKKQPLMDIHDQAVRGFNFFPSGEQTKNLPGKAFRAEPRELSFLPLVLPEPPPRPCPASWMDEPIRA